LIKSSEEYRKGHEEYLDTYMSDSTVTRGLGGKASHEWLSAHEDDYNLVRFSKELSGKHILLIGGWEDNSAVVEEHTIPFYRALKRNDAQHVKVEIYHADHSFKNDRDRLYQCVLDWINK
jgi:dipeptidyl aminopeptidase/acylaminoacyl peptidase